MKSRDLMFLAPTALALTSALVVSQVSPALSQPPDPFATTAAIVLGVGSTNIDAERSGTSVGIVVGGTLYVFDAGPGVERRILEARPKLEAMKVQKLGPVFISHLHIDHTLGLAALLFYNNLSGNLSALDGVTRIPGDGRLQTGGQLTVYGPGPARGARGIRELIDGLRASLFSPVVAPGIKEEGQAGRDGPQVEATEIKPGVIYKDSNVTVTAFEVEHKTPIAFGFRIQTPDRVIVISGDTRPSDAVVKACNGCDLLFHEVYGMRFSPGGPTGNAQGHTSAEELGVLAGRARPKRLVVYHDPLSVQGLGGLDLIRKAFSGEVSFARDLDIFCRQDGKQSALACRGAPSF